MPRHPPCALKHFNHNKMLASTMQHSTHNHTPTPPTHHSHTGSVRDPGQEQPCREQHQPGVFSGPNSVPNPFIWSYTTACVPPSCAPPAQKRDPRSTESEIRTTTTLVTHDYSYRRGMPHQHGETP